MPYSNVNGTNLYYEIYDFSPFWQTPTTPLLLLHGLGTDHTVWQRQVSAFAEHRAIIAPDLRGHGRSEKPYRDSYSIEGFAEDICVLLERLEYEKAHVVGASMGGLVAQEIAIKHPGKVQSLILVSTFCEPPDEAEQNRIQELHQSDKLEAYFRRLLEGAIAPQSDPRLLKLILALEVNNPRFLLESASLSTFSYSSSEQLRHITCPTLIVVGDQDRSTPPILAVQLQRGIRHAKLKILEDVGHLPYLEDPATFNQAVLQFLANH
jgi:pimeloyl-ACP methyl ester carboxylesterase